MRAGRLRQNIWLLAPITSTDAAWGDTQRFPDLESDADWANYANSFWFVSAEVKQLNGKEVAAEDGVVTKAYYKVSIRYREDVTTQWRINYKGRMLDIISVIDVDERHQELEIEAVANGQ